MSINRAHNAISNQRAIISLKEAKKKLSPEVKANLTDDQIVFIVTKLESIAREFIECSIPKNNAD